MTHNHRHHDNSKSTGLRRALRLLLCLIIALTATTTYAQVIIGGDVYGGGKEGAVNNNTSAANATSVTIQGTQTKVRTVFGGGQEGAVTGNTVVEIKGGVIGHTDWNGTVHGGVFGAGDGANAVVDGASKVTITSGTIYNNIYGGGNQANLKGSTDVILQGGTMQGDVYGGARMADIEGRTFVNIDGANATNSLIVRGVYGGNDISGVISGEVALPEGFTPKHAGIDNTWNAIVYASQNTTQPVIIGALYGGGNGDYRYVTNSEDNTKLDITLKKLNEETGELADVTYTVTNTPELGKTYIELNGGIYGQVYGGGNFATVTGQTVIYANNSTAIGGALSRIDKSYNSFLGLFVGVDYVENGDNMVFNYHVNRMFGGNNQADMAIRPTWDLQKADINNLYSGGNRGDMTHPNGIAIAIQGDDMRVNNVYGGCRMADVKPSSMSSDKETIYDYEFEPGYAARVYITGGKINNVYGGNDISGKVYYGTNVEIHGAISGDVYGGGNGSYAYTDKADWRDAHPEDADYYYNPGDNSLAALYQHRPHVEKTLLHVTGTESKQVVVAGGVFCGGNSATLAKDGDQTGATATFKIGKYIDIKEVYLGSNGMNMIAEEGILKKYAEEGFSSLDLTDSEQFAEYMEGVTVDIIPNIEWDDNLDYTTRIGSFFCGGNVGSMTYNGVAGHSNAGKIQMEFPEGLTIFEKIVAGCNSANVDGREGLNAAYEGGLVGTPDNNGTKVRMLVRSRLEPGKLDIVKENQFLTSATYSLATEATKLEAADGSAVDGTIYKGGNVYGGCYASGYVNGGVEINVNRDLISPDTYKDNTHKTYLANTGNYVHASAMAIYGGGYGEGTEIRGNTQINFSQNGRALLAFGGGQMGKIGNDDIIGNAEVNFDKDLVLPGDEKDNLNVYRAYAGGYAGLVTGNTTLNLYSGGVISAFAGACNADIKGYAAAYVGHADNYGKGLPYVTNAVYGGNDFGGQIEGSAKYTIDGTVSKTVRTQTYVKYMSGKIGKALYGGSYGSYNYANTDLYPADSYTAPTLETLIEAQDGDTEENFIPANTFVDIASASTSDKDIIGSDNSDPNNEVLTMIAGGGRGYKGLPGNVKVSQTYVLLRGASSASRDGNLMAHRVYGGGNLSEVVNTRIDAYSGSYGRIFGGTHGVMTELAGDLDISYDCGNTTVNYYMEKADMDVFGAGANSGASKAEINLFSGRVNEVHGGAYTEGYTAETCIKVLEGSTIHAHAIYGGGYGDTENRPCDVGVSNIIFASNDASIEDGIYGGNHNARATKQANVKVSARVTNEHNALQNVFGAGYGVNTVTGFAHVQLLPGAEVANAYGGGREGQVYNQYSYYDDSAIFGAYATNGKHATWAAEESNYNTLIEINGPTEDAVAAHVAENVYGAGLGQKATTRGKTKVHLRGGTVKGDIYGGGYAGTVEPLIGSSASTLCNIQGGQVRKVFGGGLNGDVKGDTHVIIGTTEGTTFFNGIPAIQRNVYGGSERGLVSGTATVDMYNGYVGYEYIGYEDANIEISPDINTDTQLANQKRQADAIALGYRPVLDLDDDLSVREFEDEGNVYGAGYGEGAVVINTKVNLHGGRVRNSVYGGGEIAAVGEGTVLESGDKANIKTAGATQVRMYGGLVEGDVFGGGRGYTYTFAYTGEDSPYQTTRKYTDGYVFGKTNVEIYRGTIGTVASVAAGKGNVFGGGNIGYVYSAGVKYTGETDIANKKVKDHYYTDLDFDTSTKRTEDCRVHITAYSQVKAEAGVEIDDTLYQKGEYLPTRVLNKLNPNDTRWNSLDTDGLVIRNAVFAGGNVSSGSDLVYANAVTVFGNATAAVVDVFNMDLISLGGEHVGGLYGDGNLTFVDGYRELNITNYGSDYYRLSHSSSSTEYEKLTPREQAYYSLNPTPSESGNNLWVISTTSGRKMNTIQRADFCGVFGSRILLHGARDRVPDVVDYTNYTINRVKEVSLNRVTQGRGTHGNYFGIYNVVNFLGALTSDVEFNHDVRVADEDHHHSEGNTNYGTDTYFDFKNNNLDQEFRNCAMSDNMVALASGVFLELVESMDGDEKVYGLVTGVIELDLINVKTGEGGGYVYAKNEHHAITGEVNDAAKQHLTLSDANRGAITQAAYTYTGEVKMIQTSGNFVHPNKRIVDDCFPSTGKYAAHYWYVSGTAFIYDQHISAYTGAARSFEQTTNIPLVIPANGEGTIKIVDIKANKYFIGAEGITSIRHGNKVYELNDPISYWDWEQLPDGVGMKYKEYFTDTTYIAMANVRTGDGVTYQAGDIISPKKYNALPTTLYIDEQETTVTIEKEEAFCIGNEMSKDNGYMLTFEMSNPLIWGPYFTPEKGRNKVLGSSLSSTNGYLQSPTMECIENGIYGQRPYVVNDVVSNSIIVEHKAIAKSADSEVKAAFNQLTNQAIFERTYVVVQDVEVDGNLIGEGSYISTSAYNALSDQQKEAFDSAYICINTIEVAEKEFILNGDLISVAKLSELIAGTKDGANSYLAGKVIENYFSEAYVCTADGNYGGKYFKSGQNYGALDVCALSKEERAKFNFNRDALDLFEKNFNAEVSEYHTPYNTEQLIDFTATYTGNRDAVLYKKVLKDGVYNGKVDTVRYNQGFVLTSAEYRQLVDEQWYYIPIELTEGINYIVHTPFIYSDKYYDYGENVSNIFNDLDDAIKADVTIFDNTEKNLSNAYLCVEAYTSANIGEKNSESVPLGSIITATEYQNLPNSRKNFNVEGIATIETSTLYVPRESDIFNLSSDRIITVVLDYTYKESRISEKTERHVVNIKVEFKSGLPTVGDVTPPATVLPSTTVGLSVPVITPGAYEVIGGGWELYKNEADARAHKNGVPYFNNATPMYWYQNGYYVSYYAKTYLGKAYSNYVPFSVANYHRLGEVMNHVVDGKNEYMYIDHEELSKSRPAKIYIDAEEYDSESTAADKGKNDLDYLYELYEKTYGENELDARVKGGANLVFILNSDIAPTINSWISIGTGDERCFAGTLHGNGYTISGLSNSLFGNLCGKVYNLGVTGSFTGGGIADNGTCPLGQHTSTPGYAENCWVYTTGTPADSTKAIIGNNGQVVNSYYHTDNSYAEGAAIKMDDTAFKKGEVTYLLNGFHIYKRNNPEAADGYVENFYADGDFVYANGEVPLTRDHRYNEEENKYVPIADDYLFFGQRLTYDANHNNLPTHVEKVNTLIDRTEKGNRVYRAPAYYMSKNLDKVYFNTAATFTGFVHQGLTAIDFTGYKGNDTESSRAKELLDYDKLSRIVLKEGLTKNLLIYAANSDASYNVIQSYLAEPELLINDPYLTIAPQSAEMVRGHLVDFTGETYKATRDHFLVDKENFNAPIAYTFDKDKESNGVYMWYQRTPDRFAESGSNGWDVISLPFTAGLVTTHQKGEITHFYGNSTKMHEYWLREFMEVEEGENTKAVFARPAEDEENSYEAENRFLYEYYYSKSNDKNTDVYQNYYSENKRQYGGYAYLTAATPYIVAFPGERYYEFDMSGEFVPQNTATSIAKLDKQVVTMVSTDTTTIAVTDDENLVKEVNGYQFVGTYQKKDVNGYLMKADGSAFEAANNATTVPFRGYLIKSSENGAAPRRILISNAIQEEKQMEEVTDRGLTIYSKKGAIYVESTLEHEAVVVIYSLSGQVVNRIKVMPMSKEKVEVPSRGVYIANNRKIAVL